MLLNIYRLICSLNGFFWSFKAWFRLHNHHFLSLTKYCSLQYVAWMPSGDIISCKNPMLMSCMNMSSPWMVLFQLPISNFANFTSVAIFWCGSIHQLDMDNGHLGRQVCRFLWLVGSCSMGHHATQKGSNWSWASILTCESLSCLSPFSHLTGIASGARCLIFFFLKFPFFESANSLPTLHHYQWPRSQAHLPCTNFHTHCMYSLTFVQRQ